MKAKLIVLAALLISTSVACKSELDGKTAAKVADVPAEPATAAAPSEPAEAPAAQAKTVPLDLSQTMVEWTANKVTGDHQGGFKQLQGEATFGADGSVQGISVKIDTASVYSDNEKLTKHLKSADFFDVEKYPTSTFETTKLEKGEGEAYTVTGILDLHGVKKEITFPAKIQVVDGRMIGTAEFKLQRFDFGIEYKGKPDDLINPEVLMKLHVVANTPGAA